MRMYLFTVMTFDKFHLLSVEPNFLSGTNAKYCDCDDLLIMCRSDNRHSAYNTHEAKFSKQVKLAF